MVESTGRYRKISLLLIHRLNKMSFGNKKKTTMNKILFILCLTSASLWMLSCTDYEVASYPEENETEVFNGTVLDYLSTGNERLNL